MKLITLAIAASLFAGPTSLEQAAKNDPVIRAMKDELGRAKTLKVPDGKPAYFAEFTVIDVEWASATGSLGSLYHSSRQQVRTVGPRLRVGDKEFDASGIAFRPEMAQAPFEDDYDALRRWLWLGSDGAYKMAVTDYKRQMAERKQRTKDADEPDALADATPNIHVGARGKAKFDLKKYEKVVKKASRVFRKYELIQDNGVSVTAVRVTRRYVNTEGTLVVVSHDLIGFSVGASAQAEDGAPLRHSSTWVSDRFSELDADKVVVEARRVAEEMLALRKAPVLEDYTGPVLFEGEAAAQLAAMTISPALAAGGWSGLERRFGQRVLPKGLDITDDPTAAEIDGKRVIGAYTVDDEGVPAQKLELVKDGKLLALMSSRTPVKNVERSNGHARGSAPGYAGAGPSNIVFRSKKGASKKKLLAALRKEMRSEGLEYAIIVRDLGGGWNPTSVYRIDAKGKEELVRPGAIMMPQFEDMRRLKAIGKETVTLNMIQSMGHPSFSGTGVGPMAAFSAPASITAPALLVDRIQFRKPTQDHPKPPPYPHPLFDKKKKP